jgi:hypothetical protein
MFSYLFVTNEALYLIYIDCNTIENVLHIRNISAYIFHFSFIYGHASLNHTIVYINSLVNIIFLFN